MMKKLLGTLLLLALTNSTWAVTTSPKKISSSSELKNEFQSKSILRKDLEFLREKSLALAGQAVPVLLEVMKQPSYHLKKRWVATFLLGQIMGKKAGPLLIRYTEHPEWMMRMAALKTLRGIKFEKETSFYSKVLQDKSYLVRKEALLSIAQIKDKNLGEDVWKQIFKKDNYKKTKKGFFRTELVGLAIRTLGDIGHDGHKSELKKMLDKKRYQDIHNDIRYALDKFSGSKKNNNKVILIKS